MIVEREPPLTRAEINETQLRMLKRCEIPGLLPMELDECDGQVSLRYSLNGTRMLSEALRVSHWTMVEMMEALCRLAGALEECRLYLLDADRIRLRDEFIFVGRDWHDLRLTYLPIDMPTLYRADDLERLIVRWTMRVKEPEGQVLQQVLRLVATDGFVPSALGRYAKRYLTEAQRSDKAERFGSPGQTGPAAAAPSAATPVAMPFAEPRAERPKANRSWDLLQPVSGDPRPISELWGDSPPEPRPKSFGFAVSGRKEVPSRPPGQAEKKSSDDGRRRIWIGCAALFALALAWKFVYLDHPTRQSLLVALGITLGLGAAALFLWNGRPFRRETDPDAGDRPSVREIEEAFHPVDEAAPGRWRLPGAIADRSSGARRDEYESDNAPDPFEARPGANTPESAREPGTTWLDARPDQTALLERWDAGEAEGFCLVWKTKDRESRIPLQGQSFVIGRSAEAAQHVDDTMGISRAHVEFVRVSDRWKVKDLGSRNGTRLNDEPMAPYELYALREGDVLTLARSRYSFEQSGKS